MSAGIIIYIAGALFVYGMVSKRLRATPASGPIVFVAFGLVAYATGVMEPIQVVGSPVSVVLEFTLALLLFSDASKVHIRSWEAEMDLPTRLLSIGMPLTIVFGTFAAALMFPSVGLVGAAIIATILSPTDAALGRAVVENPRVPLRIREALGIEAGLNDGIALPILLFLAALAKTEEGVSLWRLVLEGIGIGAAVGLAAGALAAVALQLAVRRGWIATSWMRIAVVAVAIITFLVADELGGSGFIAAYVGGNTFGRVIDVNDHATGEFNDDLGNILAMVSFLLFGAYILGPNQSVFGITTVVYALLSLTVIRMIPVAISMIGTGLRAPTVVYLGWFGPRGLASIIFAGVLIEETGLDDAQGIVGAVIVTVTLSVILHGVSAPWGAKRYADWYERAEAATDGKT